MKIIKEIENILKNQNFEIISSDFKRPWGGFIVIDENLSDKFLDLFFDTEFKNKIDFKTKLSPKILVIKPNKRLSWQYHNRRSEIWSVIKGDILVSRSQNDNEGSLIQLKKGEQIEIASKIRHRIIGTEDYALVAEIWIHTDKNNPSDENDIIRLQDDFNRN